MNRVCCILLLVQLFAFKVYSQNQEPIFKHFSTSDGLPSSQIYQVIQDNDGYIWFATDHGVSKYNGYEFVNYTSANGLKDNTVFKLYIDNSGKMWMQTFSGQLFYIENNKIISYKYNNKIIDLVKSNIPKGFYIDKENNAYFTSGGIGEFKIDKNGFFHKLTKNSWNEKFNQVFIDEIDNSHFIISGFINSFKKMPLHFYFNNKDYINDSISNELNDNGQIIMTKSRSGKILISISKYLFDFNNGNLILLDEFPGVITNFNEDKEHNIWVSTYSGIYVCDKNFSKSKRKTFLNKEFVTCSIEDNEGGFWITTLNRGIYYLNSKQINNYIFKETDTTEPICLNSDNKYIYAGFRDGTVAKINSKSIDSLCNFSENSFISHIYSDTISHKVYLSKINPGYLKDDKFIPFRSKILMGLKGNFLLRKSGEFLNASINGIYKISNDSISVKYYLAQRANYIFEDYNNNLLIGCNNGLFKINEESGAIKLFLPLFKNMRVDEIKQIDSTLFIATRGNGLAVVEGNNVIFITEKNGLCSNILHHIVVNKNNIWCASYKGLSRIEIIKFNPLKYIITNVGIHEGLPNNEINDITVFQDTVWVASKTAISFFYQNEDFSNKIPAILHFTSFTINSINKTLVDNIRLPYTSNNIKIGFEALSYKSYGSITYKYYLIHDADTFSSLTQDRHVEFLSLKPGNYDFQVTAMNSSGLWNKNIRKLRFTISLPYWQTWWFISICLLSISLIIFLIFKSRISRIKKEAELKTDFSKQLMILEIKALRAQMNPHFIFNVINSIQDYILKNDSKSAHRYLTKFAKLIRLILDNSFEGEVLLSEEIKANVLYMELELQRFEDKFEFRFVIDDEIDTNSILIPSIIIQPFLENSIKHGLRHLEKKGLLLLKISQMQSNLIIIIEDDGIGRKAAREWNNGNINEHISRGSFITSKRVEAYNKAHNTSIELSIVDIDDKSTLTKGTRVELKIPIKYKITEE